ncbi:MAG: hypothetical protein WCF57_21010 [Pyrinomonadaceae bacterium]
MQRLALILFSILILLIALPQRAFAQVSWQQLTDKEAGFTIGFPGKPTYEQSADPTLVHQTESYRFFYNDRRLQSIFAPLTRQLQTSADVSDAFAEITRVQAKDGRLLRQVKLPDGGRQYDNVTTSQNGTAFHRTRVYIHNGRYYAISYSIYAADGLDEREAEHFFSSFRFINGAAAQPTVINKSKPRKSNGDKARRNSWYSFRSPDGDFVVSFPGRPEFREFPNPSTRISDYKYYFHYGENTFIVSFREEPAAATQPEIFLRQALEKALENNSIWRVLQHKQMRDGGHYIESQGVIDGTPVYMRTKLYLRGTRLYYISTITQNLTGPNKDDVVKFLSSFRLR